jgi:hypothetical protein
MQMSAFNERKPPNQYFEDLLELLTKIISTNKTLMKALVIDTKS